MKQKYKFHVNFGKSDMASVSAYHHEFSDEHKTLKLFDSEGDVVNTFVDVKEYCRSPIEPSNEEVIKDLKKSLELRDNEIKGLKKEISLQSKRRTVLGKFIANLKADYGQHINVGLSKRKQYITNIQKRLKDIELHYCDQVDLDTF